MDSKANETVVALLKEAAAVSSSLKEISEYTGWSIPTVRKRLRDLGITAPDGRTVAKQPDRKWSPDKQKFLEENGSSMGLAELARALDVNVSTVRVKARQSGVEYLRKNGQGAPRTVWTEDRLEELRELASEFSHKELAEHFGVSPRSVQGAMQDYQISGRGRSRVRSPEERTQISQTLQKKILEKYPPEGPWECFQCKEEKPRSEFPENSNSGHVCYECQRLSQVERTYGITRTQYLEMFEAQDGKCTVCRNPEWRKHPKTGRLYALSVDHDHTCCPGKKSCGKCVRGLLCDRCNNMLGHVEAEGVWMGLVNYLSKWSPDPK